jgi:LacI family transcriptional regulator
MKERVTIVDVARQAAVAVSTVSRVLNGGYASPAVREKVQQVVRDMGFVPSTSARGLKLGCTGLIGFVAWNTQGAWTTGLLHGIEEELVGRAMTVALASVGLRDTFEPSAVQAWIAERRVDGLIFARALSAHRALVEAAKVAKIPAVVIAPDEDFGYGLRMTADNMGAGRLAAQHLVELGHRRIAFLGGPRSSLDARDRLAGIEEVLAAHGIALEPEHVGFAPSYAAEACTAYARRWLTYPRDTRPTAVILGNDEMAMHFVRIALGSGVRVPNDVSVVGFDGIPETARFWPGLTTVAQPLGSMGSVACRLLLQMIDGANNDHLGQQISFQTELVVRETTAPVPDRNSVVHALRAADPHVA